MESLPKNEVGTWGVATPEKAPASGFYKETREGEKASFEEFDPEYRPIQMINWLLDKKNYDSPEGKKRGEFLARRARKFLERIRDNNEGRVSAQVKEMARRALEENLNSALKNSFFTQAIGVIVEVAAVHPDMVDVEYYMRMAQELRDKVYRTAGKSAVEETPIVRPTALDARPILLKLKKDLQNHGMKDQN